MASIASARVGREQQLPEDAVEEIEEPEPEAPPRLRAAGEDVLRRGQEVRSSSLESDVGDRLLRVLHQVGRIDHVCQEHAGGLFGDDREPRDEWEREDPPRRVAAGAAPVGRYGVAPCVRSGSSE
jgi:hypothetical protein